MTAPNRFYQDVSADDRADRHGVLLDGKPVRTPGRQPLLLPTRGLAEAVADEWREQGDKIDPYTMPLTRLANTALDRIAAQRVPVIDAVAAYGAMDLLCYRVASPASLVARQEAEWQPLLDWAAERYAARLTVTAAIDPIEQDAGALAALRQAVSAQATFALAGLAEMVGILGSLVLGLAVVDGRLTGERAFALSQLDESFQAARWGEDLAAARRRDGLGADLAVAERFVRLAQS